MHWYALAVKPWHERTVARHAEALGLEAFVPLYRSRRAWSDRKKELEIPLFPGYTFARFRYGQRVPILSIPGVRSIISLGKAPAPVPDHEIAALKTMVASGVPLRPWPFLEVGQRVRIERGPLGGLEGILVRHKKDDLLVVSVQILRRSVAAEIDRSQVAPLSFQANSS